MLLFFVLACGDDYGECTPDGPLGEGEVADGEINGTCAPEGEVYTDHFSCDGVEGPCRGEAQQGAVAQVAEDPERATDPDLPWVLAQLEACSCSCCHNNQGESAHIWSWDFAPVWTDSIETERLMRMAEPSDGDEDIDPADNNGFSRAVSGMPTTDGQRLLDYLQREVARRGP